MNTVLKEIIRRLIKKSPMYCMAKQRLLSSFSYKALQESVESAIRNVPYYHTYGEHLKIPFSIGLFLIYKSLFITICVNF